LEESHSLSSCTLCFLSELSSLLLSLISKSFCFSLNNWLGGFSESLDALLSLLDGGLDVAGLCLKFSFSFTNGTFEFAHGLFSKGFQFSTVCIGVGDNISDLSVKLIELSAGVSGEFVHIGLKLCAYFSTLGVLELIEDSLGISLSITNDCLELVDGSSEFSLDLSKDWLSLVFKSVKYGLETSLEVLELAFERASEILDFSLGLLGSFWALLLKFTNCLLCLTLDLVRFWCVWHILLDERKGFGTLLLGGGFSGLTCLLGLLSDFLWGSVDGLAGGSYWVVHGGLNLGCDIITVILEESASHLGLDFAGDLLTLGLGIFCESLTVCLGLVHEILWVRVGELIESSLWVLHGGFELTLDVSWRLWSILLDESTSCCLDFTLDLVSGILGFTLDLVSCILGISLCLVSCLLGLVLHILWGSV